MRRVDLHAYPGTAPWIASQGRYVEHLSRYWKRDWAARSEAEVVADFRAHGIEAVLVAFDIESVTDAPACGSDYVAGLRDRYPDTFIQAWGVVDPTGGEKAIRQAEQAVAEHGVRRFSPRSPSLACRSWSTSAPPGWARACRAATEPGSTTPTRGPSTSWRPASRA